MEQKRSLPDPDDLTSGTWIVAIPPTPRAFIGRVVEADGNGPPMDNAKEQVFSRNQILKATWVSLFPVFDFLTTTRQIPVVDKNRKPLIDPNTGGPQLAMERAPYVNPLDFTIHPTPLDVRVQGLVAVYHFSQMHQSDVATYRSFLQQALDAQQEYRKAQSGIVTPSASEREELRRKHGHA